MYSTLGAAIWVQNCPSQAYSKFLSIVTLHIITKINKINQITDPDNIFRRLQIGITMMQIGILNNFGYARMRMDQDVPYTYEGQFCTQT